MIGIGLFALPSVIPSLGLLTFCLLYALVLGLLFYFLYLTVKVAERFDYHGHRY